MAEVADAGEDEQALALLFPAATIITTPFETAEFTALLRALL
jgi:hypothetical protein